MKPFGAFLYVLLILGGFLVVSFFFGEPGFLKPKESPSALKETGSEEHTAGAGILAVDSLKTEVRDTLQAKVSGAISQNHISQELNAPGLKYPSGDSSVLSPFFLKLKELPDRQSPLRIMYFGDSQIEGDRITSALRKQFQQKFGGAGIGMIAPDLLYNITHSFTVERSENWVIINFPNINDSVKNRSVVFKTAVLFPGREGWFRIRQIRKRENEKDYQKLRIFYRSPGECGIILKSGGKVIYKGEVAGATSFGALDFDFNFTPPDIGIYFHPTDSFELSAFSLEAKSGVQVDNIALRGLSFPPFSKSDEQAMEETAKLISPGLLILHYGVNIAPQQLKEYNSYRDQLVREIKRMKHLFSGIPVLLIGISDMGRKENGQVVSYPNIRAIREAQSEAARICNCAFWDLEEFMGGTGSMTAWVNASPQLGQKDYVHFTTEGAEKTGNHLAALILTGYEEYLRNPVTE
ncbi:MAG: hypothetical protein RBS73_10635 [Prolixibacteraceae bacterium]|jgi:hypothetical protein|nr:hypothetical protein [Prolixibacteraceae bacterium]